MALSSPNEWCPAFFAVANKTRGQRRELAVRWLRPRCGLENERLRGCLRVEISPPVRKEEDDDEEDEVGGERGEVEEGEEEQWDEREFAEAFREVMDLG